MAYLKKSCVQNTITNERPTIEPLEPFAGEWLQAAGEYRTAEGKVQRAATTIGPQYGTLEPDLVKEAAREAVRGVGFDVLIVCGFALHPHVAEETRRYGNLTVLTRGMNPDLLMGDGLLRKTGAANLFMVFGEPDLEVKTLPAGKLQVELRGLDVYDPTTHELRNNSTGDVACWFIDTSYNGESFSSATLTSREPISPVLGTARAGANEIAYDYLVVALGADLAPDAIPGREARLAAAFPEIK